jgi:acyl-CoA synthetase (AMP-forming)/AMP-acid ligase II
MRHEPIAREGVAKPRRVEEIVAFLAIKAPERIALVQDGRHCTYGELQNAVAVAAKWLAQQGARPRDRVLLVCENSFAAVALYFACAAGGAWPVIVNARLSAREIDDIAAHCESRLMLFTIAGSARAEAHAERLGATMLSDLGGMGAVAAGPLNERATPEPEDGDGQSDVAALIYTTGTTGRPKGVMLTHANLLFVARATAQARGLTSEDRVYATLPISHALGLTGVLLGSLLCGAQVHLTSRFDPARALAELRNGGISVMIGTPSMYALLVEYAKRNRLVPIAAPSLRLMSSAGAPLDAATKADAEAAFGQTLHNGYGISECGPSIALTSLDAPRGDCSVGCLLPGVEAKLVAGASGEGGARMGELWIRSPGVMKGYYRAPEETRAAIDDAGWFRTGDLAQFDDDHLFIVGRAKEMIIRFGFNVYPAEVEAVLNEHPHVVRSVVTGRARNGTEDILAFVQMVAGATTKAAELADYSASRLAPYKRPTQIILVPEMPINANGKVAKAELLAKWAASDAAAPASAAA